MISLNSLRLNSINIKRFFSNCGNICSLPGCKLILFNLILGKAKIFDLFLTQSFMVVLGISKCKRLQFYYSDQNRQ